MQGNISLAPAGRVHPTEPAYGRANSRRIRRAGSDDDPVSDQLNDARSMSTQPFSLEPVRAQVGGF